MSISYLCGHPTKAGHPCKNPVSESGAWCGQCLGVTADGAGADKTGTLSHQASGLEAGWVGPSVAEMKAMADSNGTADMIEQLAYDQQQQLADDCAMCQIVHLTGEDVADYFNTDPPAGDYRKAASKTATAEELAELAASSDPLVRAVVASRSAIPEEVRTALLGDTDPLVAAAAASSRHLTAEQIDMAVNHPDKHVRAAVATNWNLSEEQLVDLVAGDSDLVVAEVFKNKKIDSPVAVAVVVAAAKSDRPGRRQLAAANPQAGTIAVAHPELNPANDPDSRVRATFAANPTVYGKPLMDVVLDHDPHVSRRAVRNPSLDAATRKYLLNTHPDLVAHPDDRTRSGIAAWDNHLPVSFEEFSVDTNRHVREAAMANRSCPASVLTVGIGDLDAGVRAAAIRNPNLPQWRITELVAHADSRIRSAVAGNPALSFLNRMHLAKDSNQHVRAAAGAAAVEEDKAVIEVAMNDEHWRPRAAAASNVHATAQQLDVLSEDGDYRVRSAAMTNPNFNRG